MSDGLYKNLLFILNFKTNDFTFTIAIELEITDCYTLITNSIWFCCFCCFCFFIPISQIPFCVHFIPIKKTKLKVNEIKKLRQSLKNISEYELFNDLLTSSSTISIIN